MDTAAFALARDNGLPIIVFNIHEAGRLGADRGRRGGRHAGFRRLSGPRRPMRYWDSERWNDGLDFKDLNRRMHGAVSVLKTELSGLRTGRASPISSIRSWSTPTGSRCRSTRSRRSTCRNRGCSPCRSGTSSSPAAVDRAIREANLGLNPIMEGTLLRIPIPELNARAPAGDGQGRRTNMPSRRALPSATCGGRHGQPEEAREGRPSQPGRHARPVGEAAGADRRDDQGNRRACSPPKNARSCRSEWRW